MAEFSYARGRISDSLQFIAKEIQEFDREFLSKTWQDYQNDSKLQKLMERTIENILTALVEVCGTILAEKGKSAENYSEVLSQTAQIYGFTPDEQKDFAKLAVQRNRLAHRYLDLKWEAVKMFKDKKALIEKLAQKILGSA